MPFADSMPVAASATLAPVVDGPPQDLRVAGVGRHAAYLTGADGALVALVARGAVAPSCAAVLPPGVRPDDLLHAGDLVRAGAGALSSPAHRWVVARWWVPADVVPRHPRIAARSFAAVATLTALLDDAAAPSRAPSSTDPWADRARAAAAPAVAALARGDVDAAAQALTAVLGLGPGLTPSGDDVAAGLLLMLRASAGADGAPRPADVDRLAAHLVAAAPTRTGTVSAALLAEAAAGRAAAPVARAVRLLAGLEAPLPGATYASVFGALLAIGHYSGTDLAAGMLAAADLTSSPISTTTFRRTA